MPSTSRPRASVVIPSYRGRRVLPDCLFALAEQDLRDFETIVVDDASGDGTAKWIEASFPWVRVVALATNKDFCGAVNTGIRAARADIVALLNDDTIPATDWLRPLVEELERDERLGFVASRMLSAHNPEIIDGAGDGYTRHGLAYRVGRGERDDGQYKPRPILWASGGASAYRRQALLDVGLLDESFQIYYEDIDVGLALRSRGWSGRYVPASSVRHLGSVNDTSSARAALLTTRNSLVVLAKHWPYRLLVTHGVHILHGQFRNALWAWRHGLWKPWYQGLHEGVRAWRPARASARTRPAIWADELELAFPFRPLLRHRSRMRSDHS